MTTVGAKQINNNMNTTEQKFDLEYFIAKFEAIPELLWTTGRFVDDLGCKCAYGHCGAIHYGGDTLEGQSLLDIDLENSFRIAAINDNSKGEYNNFGSTPKERVVNYLKSLR